MQGLCLVFSFPGQRPCFNVPVNWANKVRHWKKMICSIWYHKIMVKSFAQNSNRHGTTLWLPTTTTPRRSGNRSKKKKKTPAAAAAAAAAGTGLPSANDKNSTQYYTTQTFISATKHVLGCRFVVAGFLKAINSCLQFSFPILINQILKFIETTQSKDYDEDARWHVTYRGYWLAACLLLTMAGKAVVENLYFHSLPFCLSNAGGRFGRRVRQGTPVGKRRTSIHHARWVDQFNASRCDQNWTIYTAISRVVGWITANCQIHGNLVHAHRMELLCWITRHGHGHSSTRQNYEKIVPIQSSNGPIYRWLRQDHQRSYTRRSVRQNALYKESMKKKRM